MKKVIGILLVSSLLAACNSSKNGNFELSGTLTNPVSGDYLYLEELSPMGKKLLDSAQLDDKGNFIFKNAHPSAGFYRLMANEQNFAMLVLDSTQKIKLSGDYKDLGNSYNAEGSEDTRVFLDFNKMGRSMQQRSDSMQQAFQSIVGTLKMDSLRMDSISKVFEPVYNKMINDYQQQVSQIVLKNKSSLAVLAGIQQLNPDKFLDIYRQVYDALNAKYPGNKYLANLHNNILAYSKVSEGSVAPEINLPTPDGKMLALSSFKGKVVMIDFWASWCGPCRKENPNVLRLYKKYHDKGFEIYAVSLDDKKDKWIGAIESDGLPWNHVSELKGWQTQICEIYGVDAIPATFLLDKEGKIMAKNLRGKELEAKLEEIFGAN